MPQFYYAGLVLFFALIPTFGCMSQVDANNAAAAKEAPLKSDVATTSNTAAASIEQLTASARVGSSWQKRLLLQMVTEGASEAWGLFSSAGWVDQGQVMVLNKNTDLLVSKVAPGTSEALPQFIATPAQAGTFLSQIRSADKLQDLAAVNFDGLKYEYLHAKRDGDNNVTILRRIYMVNVTKKTAQHSALVKAFQELSAQ